MRESRIIVVLLFIALIACVVSKLRSTQSAHAATVVQKVTLASPAAPAKSPSAPLPAVAIAKAAQPAQVPSPIEKKAEAVSFEDEADEAIIVSSEPAKNAQNKIDSETLEAAVAAVVPSLNHCYREALLRDTSVRGDITIELTVSPQEGAEQATIEDAAVDAEEFQAPLFEQCMLSAMMALKLPKPASRLYISYPFTLDPDGNDS